MSQLLTLGEVAKRINVHPETVRRWLKEGRIRGIRIGRDWRFDPDDIDRLIQGSTS